MRPGDIELFDRMVERIAPRFAKVLGVPVVLANRTGRIQTPMPAGLGIFDSNFSGLSRIVDSDASVKARLGTEEGVIVAEVHLGPTGKGIPRPRCYGKMWALPVPWYAPMWPQTQKDGELAYADNDLRKQRALMIH
jgi:N-carbamoylputrescine amidase